MTTGQQISILYLSWINDQMRDQVWQAEVDTVGEIRRARIGAVICGIFATLAVGVSSYFVS